MLNKSYILEELDINLLEEDPDQPRNAYRDTDEDEKAVEDGKLLNSIQNTWILVPIIINKDLKNDRYMIIDGHRRYNVAKSLGFETVPCRIYEWLKESDFVGIQFQVQNIRKDWKPYERANAIKKIRRVGNFSNNSEIAHYLGLSTTVVRDDLYMMELATPLLDKMSETHLTRTYRVEFVRLRPKLRKIKNFEVHTIEDIIFKKVQNNVIRNAKDFRKLSKIFLRAKLNEDYIEKFLLEEDMDVPELEKLTIQSRIGLLTDEFLELIGNKLQEDIPFDKKKELIPIIKLRDFLRDVFDKKEYPSDNFKF